jgi:four helix bundle protein
MKDNLILDKSIAFSVRIVKLYKYLFTDKKEYIMSKQILRSGTSIGANIHEAVNAQSRKDFISKMHIAFKETAETKYWIILLTKTHFLNKKQSNSILNDCIEIEKILSSIIKTTKNNF